MIPNPYLETRDNVQDIDPTAKEKILVAPLGSAAIFSFAVGLRACAESVFPSTD